MRKKRIKKAFTLVEIIIALSLFTMVMASVFNIFLCLSRSEKALLASQEKTEKLIFFQMRMRTLFSQLAKKKSKEFFFFTLPEGPPSLVFAFEKRADRDTPFVDKVIVRLLVDGDALVLLSWPLPPKKELPKKMRKEVLLENVQAVKYSFFGKAQDQEGKRTSHWEEVPTWKKDAPAYPLRICLQVTFLDETQVSFWFLLSQGVEEIIYHG